MISREDDDKDNRAWMTPEEYVAWWSQFLSEYEYLLKDVEEEDDGTE